MIVKIEFEVELPDVKGYDDKELDEYLKYQYNDRNSLHISNPFIGDGKQPKPINLFWYKK